ncbi:MAG: hypothetical protein WCS20_12380, partial [Alphaproteobacteria bacterium]
QITVETRNPNPAEITDPHPQRRPHRQPSESAARAALLPASHTMRRDTIWQKLNHARNPLASPREHA